MSIMNGYASLAEIKERMLRVRTYTAATISFVTGTKKIADSAYGLKRFQAGDILQVSGSTDNDGYYTVTTGDTANEIVVSEALTDEAAGDTVTIVQVEDQIDDATLESMVEAISRSIDDEVGTRFYTTAENETRYFTSEFTDELWPGDILSVTTLKTDDDGDRVYETVWTATDYDLEPFNASLDGKPYTALAVTPKGNYSFPTGAKGVELVAKYGYSSTTPARIQEACLLAAARLFGRKDAVFGVVGTLELGELRHIITGLLRTDTEIAALLYGYQRGLGPVAV